MSELKPCPFCGMNGEAKYTVDYGGRTIFQCQWCGASHHSFDDWNNRPIEDELRASIAELEAAQRWIPVSERLPEDRATILAAFKNQEILTATYYEHYEGFGGVENYWHIEGWHSGNVTHWMPLPQPPEVK